jgi:hypothetical protein
MLAICASDASTDRAPTHLHTLNAPAGTRSLLTGHSDAAIGVIHRFAHRSPVGRFTSTELSARTLSEARSRITPTTPADFRTIVALRRLHPLAEGAKDAWRRRPRVGGHPWR